MKRTLILVVAFTALILLIAGCEQPVGTEHTIDSETYTYNGTDRVLLVKYTGFDYHSWYTDFQEKRRALGNALSPEYVYFVQVAYVPHETDPISPKEPPLPLLNSWLDVASQYPYNVSKVLVIAAVPDKNHWINQYLPQKMEKYPEYISEVIWVEGIDGDVQTYVDNVLAYIDTFR